VGRCGLARPFSRLRRGKLYGVKAAAHIGSLSLGIGSLKRTRHSSSCRRVETRRRNGRAPQPFTGPSKSQLWLMAAGARF
jgi:hypothetical protein